jgi:hypothetical protein
MLHHCGCNTNDYGCDTNDYVLIRLVWIDTDRYGNTIRIVCMCVCDLAINASEAKAERCDREPVQVYILDAKILAIFDILPVLNILAVYPEMFRIDNSKCSDD